MSKVISWRSATQKAARDCTHPMPWQRGTRRAAMIARREGEAEAKSA